MRLQIAWRQSVWTPNQGGYCVVQQRRPEEDFRVWPLPCRDRVRIEWPMIWITFQVVHITVRRTVSIRWGRYGAPQLRESFQSHFQCGGVVRLVRTPACHRFASFTWRKDCGCPESGSRIMRSKVSLFALAGQYGGVKRKYLPLP